MTMLLSEAVRPAPSAGGAGAPDVAEEHLPVSGRLPAELRGRYLRVAPGPQEPARAGFCVPPWSGGLVHGLLLGEGRARWHRRQSAGRTQVAGPGERGVGRCSHPSVDPASGELHAVASYPDLPFVEHLVLAADGQERGCDPIPVPGAPLMHAFSLTSRHVVLYDLPARHSRAAALVGARAPYRWDADHRARIGVLRRGDSDAGAVRWVEVPQCFVVHTVNAYDDGERILLDVIKHDRAFGPEHGDLTRSAPTLWRWTVEPGATRVREEQLSDRPQEFPTIDDRRRGSFHRYAYSVGLGTGRDRAGRTVFKHDLVAGTVEAHEVGPGRTVDEAVFVPRSPDSAEDDGWLLAVANDAGADRSEVLVLDARQPSAPPVAVVHLPVRLPAGCHASWSPTG
jgi:carotenoid cleavage dioxygenase-like enzyme